ncbi:TetR/AcrR family transcriptional regulator [uncultured Amnibacterium sp.]|uniref:TetR/AcrR family transcriptional regulator n=1 Tax=uncultured Amnibacterium sp. TaxID=1631851 RepID=UPI0035CA8E20
MVRGYHHGDLPAALVAAAIDELAEGGLAGFSVAKVAKRVGVSPGAPYRHFRDRDELLVAVAVESTEAMVQRLREAVLDAGPDTALRFAATAGAYTRFVLDRGVGMELTFAPQFRGARSIPLAERSRALMDLLLPLAHDAVAGASWTEALNLLEAHLAIGEGFAALQRRGGLSLLHLSDDAVAARATQASLTLIRGARAAATEVHGRRTR